MLMQDFIETLRHRDMLHSFMPGTQALLRTPTTAYIGIDPTAPSLHIGNLATLMLLKHFQQAGHAPLILLGGGTAMIGDPSFKASERKILDANTIQHNKTCIQKQIEHLLLSHNQQPVTILDNKNWLQDISLLHFLRNVGKHITINYMTSKEAIKTRLQTGISYTEFAYPLLQAYDFYHLYTKYGVKLQMGGSDQWGNITTGTDFIRRKTGQQAFGLTTSLITKRDGSKFGKTEQGTIWLDPKLTSVYQFYQFWLNCSDEEATLCIKKLTLIDLPTIILYTQEHDKAPHKRLLQKQLAKAITIMVHGNSMFQKAKKASELLFDQTSTTADLYQIDQPLLLEALEDIPQCHVYKSQVHHNTTLLDLLHTLTQGYIFSSKRSAREMIQGGGVRINKIKITNPEHTAFTWLWQKYLLVQKGKKNYYLIQLT